MRMRWVTALLLVAALAVPLLVLDAAPANPLVGVWTILLPDAPGGDPTYLDIRPGGNYLIYSQVTGIGQEGTFTVTPPNHWRLVAKTTSYADAGTYRLEGKKYLYLTGKLGTGKWTRVTRSPYVPQRMISGQFVPMDVPLFVRALVANARKKWRSDAIPIGLDISDGNPVVGNPMPHYGIPYFKVTVTVYSPSAHSAWEVMVSPFSFSAIKDSNPVSTYPLPAKFVDLPQVIATARQHGMRGPFKDADMEDYRQWGPVWEIDSGLPGSSATGSFQVRASGAYLPASTGLGPVGFTKAAHKAELAAWNKAIANLRSTISHAASSGGPGRPCPFITTAEGGCMYVSPEVWAQGSE